MEGQRPDHLMELIDKRTFEVAPLQPVPGKQVLHTEFSGDGRLAYLSLLDREGALKVMDFGVARLAERTSTLTESGLIVGTPAYMSPEQLLAEKIDARSDIYSVGVVMYECLTGALPFEAESTVSRKRSP